MRAAWRRDHPGMNCDKKQADQSLRTRQATRPGDHRIRSLTDRPNNKNSMIFWRLSGGERRVGHGAPHRAPIFDRPIRTVCMILRQWECNTSPSTQPASNGGILLVLKCADFCRQLFVSLHLNMTATVPLMAVVIPPFFPIWPVPYPTSRLPPSP